MKSIFITIKSILRTIDLILSIIESILSTILKQMACHSKTAKVGITLWKWSLVIAARLVPVYTCSWVLLQYNLTEIANGAAVYMIRVQFTYQLGGGVRWPNNVTFTALLLKLVSYCKWDAYGTMHVLFIIGLRTRKTVAQISSFTTANFFFSSVLVCIPKT